MVDFNAAAASRPALVSDQVPLVDQDNSTPKISSVQALLALATGRISYVTTRLYYTRSATTPNPPLTDGVTTTGTPPVVNDATLTDGETPETIWYREVAAATGTDPLWAVHIITLGFAGQGENPVACAGPPARYAVDPTAASTAVLLNGAGLLEQSSLDEPTRRLLANLVHGSVLATRDITYSGTGLSSSLEIHAGQSGPVDITDGLHDPNGNDWQYIVVSIQTSHVSGTNLGRRTRTPFHLAPGDIGEADAEWIDASGNTRDTSFEVRYASDGESVTFTLPAVPGDARHAPFADITDMHGQYLTTATGGGLTEGEVQNWALASNAQRIPEAKMFGGLVADIAVDVTNNRLQITDADGSVGHATLPAQATGGGGLDQSAVDARVAAQAVRYDAGQSLTTGQRAQARSNIGAVATTAGEPASGPVAVGPVRYFTVQNLAPGAWSSDYTVPINVVGSGNALASYVIVSVANVQPTTLSDIPAHFGLFSVHGSSPTTLTFRRLFGDDHRAAFNRSEADGNNLRIRVRNHGGETITQAQISAQAFYSTTVGPAVYGLAPGEYDLNQGLYYWFPNGAQYSLADLELITVGTNTGGRRHHWAIGNPTSLVVYEGAAGASHDEREGDWQIGGWSGDFPAFVIAPGTGGQYWPGGFPSAWSVVRPVRAGNTPAGMIGGIHIPRAQNGRRINYIRLYPAAGVVL